MAILLVSTAVRSLVLLLLTLAIAVVCRRRSAAMVHGIWAVGMGGCLVLPVVTWLTPSWSLPLLPSQLADTSSAAPVLPSALAVPNSRPAGAGQPAQVHSVNRESQASTEKRIAPTSGPAIAQRSAESQTSPSDAAEQFDKPSLATVALAVWAMGVLAVVFRLLQQIGLTHHWAQRAEELTDPAWLELRDAAIRQLGLRCTLALKIHDGTQSPMVAGLLRPVVLLPSGVNTWSTERRKLVLLHELAHVGRQDVLTQLAAAVVCALYWFNPLTWWGANQMKRLREIACDDAVVTHTNIPADYAQTLLEVAREYRSRQLISAVAMARSSRVEDRITAILDAARSRAVLTRRSVRLLTFVAFLVAVAVGTCQLSSRAADTQEQKSDQATESQPTAPSRKMEVLTTDESGTPIDGATVYYSLCYKQDEKIDCPHGELIADGDGRAFVEIPQGIRSLKLWSSHPGYVPQFIYFPENTLDEGRKLPGQFGFRLARGTKLSGRIVDDEGQPISGVRVSVAAEVTEPNWEVNPEPMINSRLTSFGSPSQKTDTDGRWSIDNAPAPPEGNAKDYEFRLRVTHPDYLSDGKWGDIQRSQGITTGELRDGTATMRLSRGLVVSGRVTDTQGQPITKGWVVWNDEPYFGEGEWEAELDSEGRFRTAQLAAGEHPISIIAPGYAAQRRMVKAEPGMEELRFELKPGKRIEIHVVDQEGNPIPNASVYLANSSGNDTWNNSNALHNHKHPNVPDYGISRRANEEGVFVWDWAPEEAVKYEIGAKGFDSKDVRLVAKQGAHKVELSPPPTIRGKVVDAESGEPIERFRVIPVKAYRPDFYSTDFQANAVVEGKNGEYEIQFYSHGQSGNQYRVRIEAEGYRTVLGKKSLGVGDPPLEEDFRLEKVAALVGDVLDPQGKPVDSFTVAIGTPTTAPHFTIDRPETYFGKSFRVRGSNRFELAVSFEPQRIRVFNESGFVEVLCEPDEQIGSLQLQPWAKLSGRLMQGEKPIAGEGISFYPLANRGLREARFQDLFYAQTDPNGHFEFDRLPPTSGRVRAHLGPWQPSPLTSSQSLPLDLKPGEHREVVLNGDGATIAGRVVATGRSNDDLSKQWSLNYLVSRDPGLDYPSDSEPLSFDASGPLQAAWLRQPDFENWVATRDNHFVKLADDGRLRIHGVQPGQYDLVIQLYEQPAGCLVETVGEKVIPVEVAGDQSDRIIELGDIEVECRQGPRVGSDMRAYQFTDASGQVRHVNDMSGRYVLFHAWATWCAPCVESMPMLKATVKQFADAPLTVVGLNLDDDLAAAKAMVEAQQLVWAQNYLGRDSDLMRQLAVSSAPAYYLIGPDGKLIGSSNQWEQIEQLLNTALD